MVDAVLTFCLEIHYLFRGLHKDEESSQNIGKKKKNLGMAKIPVAVVQGRYWRK